MQNVYTGNYAYGGAARPTTRTPASRRRGGTATVGNAYTGKQNTAKRGSVSGPGGQSTSVASYDGNHYADPRRQRL